MDESAKINNILGDIQREKRVYLASKQIEPLLTETNAIVSQCKNQIEILEKLCRLYEELWRITNDL
jgi:hypothetical protein